MRAVRAAILLALTLSMLGYAQAPAPSVAPASPVAQGANRLPVRRVVLYKSGVGYFEHLGRVRGNQTITIDFTSGQLDDVLPLWVKRIFNIPPSAACATPVRASSAIAEAKNRVKYLIPTPLSSWNYI